MQNTPLCHKEPARISDDPDLGPDLGSLQCSTLISPPMSTQHLHQPICIFKPLRFYSNHIDGFYFYRMLCMLFYLGNCRDYKESRILQVGRRGRRIPPSSFNTNKPHSYRQTGQARVAQDRSAWSTLIGRAMSRLGSHWSRASKC